MAREEFLDKIEGLEMIVDLFGYEFLSPDEERTISSKLNEILDTLNF